jgi:hypothetical protein
MNTCVSGRVQSPDPEEKGRRMKITWCLAIGGLLILSLVAGCAPHAVEAGQPPAAGDSPAGFWKGLWHGLIIFFTFVISLFSDSVGIYEMNNTGNLYNLGYLLGVMIIFGGSGGGACKKSC